MIGSDKYPLQYISPHFQSLPFPLYNETLPKKSPLQCGAPKRYKLVYDTPSKYGYLPTINPNVKL